MVLINRNKTWYFKMDRINYYKESSNIYHHLSDVVTFSQWIRILSVTKVQATTNRKTRNQNDVNRNCLQNNNDAKFNVESYSYFKYSKFQFFVNFVVFVLLFTIGSFCQGFLYNLVNNATQMIGFLVYVLVLLVFPIAIVFLSNKNTPKVSN